MTELLLDVNLQMLPDEFLAGDWRVADRVLNTTDPANALAVATRFVLQPGQVQLVAPSQSEAGQWWVQRDALMNRPYLQLQFSQQETRALITRLRRSTDGEHSLLNLYFLSGMEMQLARP